MRGAAGIPLLLLAAAAGPPPLLATNPHEKSAVVARARQPPAAATAPAAPAAPESAVEAVHALPARPPDPVRLERARMRLSGTVASGRAGPYRLFTDLRNPERLRDLDRVAAQLEEIYTGRYGRKPIGEAAEVVVLYARESDYQAFQDQDAKLANLRSSGHYGYGIVALFDGGRPGGEVISTFVHELAHLLNRRALGPMLPSWLDEGIAEELGLSRVDGAGNLLPGTLGGIAVRGGQRIQMFGGRAQLYTLARGIAEGRTRRLRELLDLDWDAFVKAEGNLDYPQSAFWIRYLLAGEGGALAPGFRAFLDAVAGGSPPSPKALRERLGRSWDELEKGYAAWVTALAADSAPELVTATPDGV